VKRPVRLLVNGQPRTSEAEPRTSLADFLREDLDLTGTHVGCEHGVCGTCTVLLDGEPIRACLMLAVQADGRAVTTVDGAARPLHPLQEAFRRTHGLQCGYCTPGILLAVSFAKTASGSPGERPCWSDRLERLETSRGRGCPRCATSRSHPTPAGTSDIGRVEGRMRSSGRSRSYPNRWRTRSNRRNWASDSRSVVVRTAVCWTTLPGACSDGAGRQLRGPGRSGPPRSARRA
jgi:aerobic-type carbon monoxide dehydrogenase small subunit (CoxS/CutS family)